MNSKGGLGGWSFELELQAGAGATCHLENIDGILCDLEGFLGPADDGIDWLKWKITAVVGILARKERIDATTSTALALVIWNTRRAAITRIRFGPLGEARQPSQRVRPSHLLSYQLITELSPVRYAIFVRVSR